MPKALQSGRWTSSLELALGVGVQGELCTRVYTLHRSSTWIFLHCFPFLKCCIKIFFSSTSEFLRHPLHVVDGVPGLRLCSGLGGSRASWEVCLSKLWKRP